MRRSLYAIPVMLCLAAVSVGAQADKPAQPSTDKPTTASPASPPSPSQQPAKPPSESQQPAKPSESSSAANKVTYTGCVKPGSAPGSWILENAEAAAKPGASASSVGTSGASKMTFSLTPSSSVDLKPHANHKIEVVGTVSAAKPSASADPSAPPSAASAAPKQAISVESVKMVSATCP
jgi:hypothetical protein